MPSKYNQSPVHLNSVVFATDFSLTSHNAGLYASAISKYFRAQLIVAHAFTLTQPAMEVEVEKPFASQQRANLAFDLMLTAEVLESGTGITESTLLEGEPSRVIPALARRRPPSLLVIGTHGRGSIDRFVLGSTAEAILRRSIGPALTVGPNVNILRASTLLIRRILYATDCSPEAVHAATIAVALAEEFSADLDVLNIVRSAKIDHPEQFHRLQEQFYGAVERILPHEAGQICQPHTFVRVGKPHTDILRHIEERGIDLLVLGLHRNAHLGMQNQTAGAFAIIVKAQCPVITVAAGGNPPNTDVHTQVKGG